MTTAENSVRQDVTADVRAFFERDYPKGTEHVVEVPGLHVVALKGMLRAGQARSDGGDCNYSLATWTENTEAPSLRVNRLGVDTTWRQSTTIETEAGVLPSDAKTLENYRFEKDVEEQEKDERAELFTGRLHEMHALAGLDPESIIGFRHELYVSVADPLGAPITIPNRYDFGTGDPLRDKRVREVSLIVDEAGERQISFIIDGQFSGKRRIPFTPLEQLKFETKPKANEKQALLNHILKLQETLGDQAADKIDELIEEYKNLRTGAVAMCARRPADNGDDRRSRYQAGLLARLHQGQGDWAKVPIVPLSGTTEAKMSFSADTILREPTSGQLYVADMGELVAISAADVVLGSPEKIERDLKSRMY